MVRQNLCFNVTVLVLALCALLVSKTAGTEVEGGVYDRIAFDVCQQIRNHISHNPILGKSKYISFS